MDQIQGVSSVLLDVVQVLSESLVGNDTDLVQPALNCLEELLSWVRFNHISNNVFSTGAVHSDQLSDLSLVAQLLFAQTFQLLGPEVALLYEHSGQGDLDDDQEVLVDVVEKVLQERVDVGFLLRVDLVLAEQVVELDDADGDGLHLLGLQDGLSQVQVLDHLESHDLGEGKQRLIGCL